MSIEGGVFSSTIEGGRAGARIDVRSDGARATTTTGQELVVAYDGATLELGGDSGTMVFLRSTDKATTIFAEGPALLDALAAAPAIAAKARDLRAQMAKKQARGRAGWIVAATLVGAVVASAVVGVVWLRGHAVEMIPWAVDEKLGELGAASVMADEEKVAAPDAEAELTKLVDKIAFVAPDSVPDDDEKNVKLEVAIIDDDVVNAAALPGGKIFVYRGLLRRFARHGEEGQRALVGVLAHEVAHVMQRHGVAQLVGNVGILALVQLALGDVSAILVAATAAIATSGYSRVHETEADADAVASLRALGLSPEALARGFELLAEGPKETTTGPVKGPDVEMPSILSSHPDTAGRVAAARAAAAGAAERPGAIAALEVDFAKIFAAVGDEKKGE